MKIPKKIIESLALRVLLVCAALLILPLLLNTFLVYRQDYVLKIGELVKELQIIGYGRARLLEEIILAKQKQLKYIALSLEGKSHDEQMQILERIKNEENLTSLSMIPSNSETLVHLPYLSKKQLIIEETLNGCTLQMGLSAQELIEYLGYLEGTPHPFYLSLLDPDGKPYVSESENLLSTPLQIFTLDEIQKKSFISALIHIEKKGGHVGVKIPIKNSSFSLLVTVPETEISGVDKSKILSRVFSLFFLILLLGTGGAIWLTRRMARPLKSLCLVMNRVGMGDLTARFEQDPMGFEINLLGNDFNRMVDSLSHTLEEVKNERIARSLLENELKIGHEIQMSILPREMPTSNQFQIAAALQSAKEVAGDFYDIYLKTEPQHLMIAIADASGKGISACLYSLSIRGMLRSFTMSHENFSERIRLTNALFCQDTGNTGAFVTAWVGNFDIPSKTLEYCSCGHPPALLKRKNGEIKELSTPNMAFGVMPFEKVYTETIPLFSGDLLLMYTDGLIETHNQKMSLLGKKHLIELVNSAEDSSAQELVNYFISKIDLFQEGAPQFDDLTLMVMKIL